MENYAKIVTMGMFHPMDWKANVNRRGTVAKNIVVRDLRLEGLDLCYADIEHPGPTQKARR